jgi:hypothetical protein
MHPNPGALLDRIAPADFRQIDQVTLTRRWQIQIRALPVS